MKAVVFHGVGDIRLDSVDDPKLVETSDAIIRITHSAICGTDLHMVRGTMPGMKAGTILGHEAVGVVEETGKQVRNLRPGDRVVVPSTVACGTCVYCRDGYHAQCDWANPNGHLAGTAFFGGPEGSGPFDGLQAEYARIPYANSGLLKLPDVVADEDALLLSDIAPTGFFGAHMAQVTPGKSVAVLGCGPVGLFAIKSAQLMGAGRLIAVDNRASRLEMARDLGAEVINFDEEQPVDVMRQLTGGIGPDCVIDAVGVDAEAARAGPAADKSEEEREQIQRESREVAPQVAPDGDLWQPGGAPSQALSWAVEGVCKAGIVSIIGVYPPPQNAFPIGMAMQRNLTLRMGNCHHRRYMPELISRVADNSLRPREVLSHREPLTDAISAYESFDQREAGWMKVELLPG